MRMPVVTIYTDGSCQPNPGPGAWAALLIFVSPSTGEVIEREISLVRTIAVAVVAVGFEERHDVFFERRCFGADAGVGCVDRQTEGRECGQQLGQRETGTHRRGPGDSGK